MPSPQRLKFTEWFDFGRKGRGPPAPLAACGLEERQTAASPETPFSLLPGELVAGRYVITRVLGRGGMGEVYEAEDRLLNETIALKTLRADLARADTIVRHFHKEIQLARKVTHPNVCRVFETGLHVSANPAVPALPFFTMELLAGEALSARIRRSRRLTRGEAFPIAVQMAKGLQAAHEAGIVHADFKSGNVLLIPGAAGDRAVITDFGLARIDPSTAASEETRTMVTEGRIAGTLAYMSPEQMTGEPITAASDIYSFGIVLFEMATGELPFDKRHAIHGAVQRVSGGSITARSVVPDLDPRWDAAIARCLQKEPHKRFGSAADIGECFDVAGVRWGRLHWTRRELGRLAVAASLPLVAVGGVWVWSRHPYQPRPAAVGWYQRGVAALHSMSYETARRAFQQAVAADPAYAMAHASLAHAYEELDYSDLAKESMLRAVSVAQESRPSGDDALKLRALQSLVSRDYDRAAPLFRQLEATAPQQEKPAAALESGWLAQLREDTEGAAAAYERALKMNPSYAAAKLRLGFILGRRRQVDAALQAFQEAETLYVAASDQEGVTETLYERARLLNRSSRSAEAEPVIEKALAIAQAVGNPYQQISLQLAQGVAVRNLGDTGRAAALARQAIDAAVAQKMDNLATNGLIDLGNSFLTAGDIHAAEPILRRALELAGRGKIRRNESRARLALGSLCEQDGRPKEARQFVEASLPFFRQAGYRREFVQATTVLGGVHRQLAEFDQGARVLREALAAAIQLHDNQTEATIRERLGENLRDQGAWPEALEEFSRAAVLLGSGGAEARWNYAVLCARLGRRPDAEQALSEAGKLLRRTPSSQLLFHLRVSRAAIAYQDGRMTDAAVLLREALPGAPEGAQPTANLLATLVRIRTRPTPADADSTADVLEAIDRSGLLLDGASARLAIAEAMIAGAKPGPAAKRSAARLALEALAFFEPRDILESTWRAHSVVAHASPEPVVAEAHRMAARAALARLSTLWSAANVAGYLERQDMAALAAGIK